MRRPLRWLVALMLAVGATTSCGAGSENEGTSVASLRPDIPGEPAPAFDTTERVERFASPGGTFVIHYTRAGRNAVPALDSDSSGVPDYVEDSARTYDEVLAFYRDSRGFVAPPSDLRVPDGNGGDGRFDVYLLDFAGRADGAFRHEVCNVMTDVTCPGYMLQENDFAGYSYPTSHVGIQILASHEFFHAIQAGYDVRRRAVLEESTAVWGTEQYEPMLNDFEGFVGGYLSRPDRSLDQVPVGPVDAFTYGAAIWFQFLTERHDNLVVRRLWTACGADDGTTGWLDVLDGILRRDYGSSMAAEFDEFAAWNLYTATRANRTRAYANGSAYPLVASTRVVLPHSDNQVRMFHSSARYFSAGPLGRTEVTAALVPPVGADADALDGLSLRIMVRTGTTVAEPYRFANLTAGTESVNVSGASELVAFITNTRTVGPSRTPGLCIGTLAEVAECRVALGVVESDAGGADASDDVTVTADAGHDAAALDEAGTRPPGCACGVHGVDRRRSEWYALSFAVALSSRSRRRRRPRDAIRFA